MESKKTFSKAKRGAGLLGNGLTVVAVLLLCAGLFSVLVHH